MASIAFLCSGNMVSGFAAGDLIIMALATGSNYFVMINGRCRNKRRGGMTRFADFGATNVQGRFTRCGNAVVARRAAVRNTTVIEGW